MHLNIPWRRAFALQARADFRTRNLLSSPACGSVPKCHQVHFLQMACEKLVKAHLLDAGTLSPDRLTSHAVIARHLPLIVNGYYKRQKKRNLPRTLYQQVRSMARSIELLAPAVDDAGRQPANCEYPWKSGNRVFAPVEFDFKDIDLAREPAGGLILKIVPIAIEALLSD